MGHSCSCLVFQDMVLVLVHLKHPLSIFTIFFLFNRQTHTNVSQSSMCPLSLPLAVIVSDHYYAVRLCPSIVQPVHKASVRIKSRGGFSSTLAPKLCPLCCILGVFLSLCFPVCVYACICITVLLHAIVRFIVECVTAIWHKVTKKAGLRFLAKHSLV